MRYGKMKYSACLEYGGTTKRKEKEKKLSFLCPTYTD